MNDANTNDELDYTLLEDICKSLYREKNEVELVAEDEDYVVLNEKRIGKNYKVIANYENRDLLVKNNPKLKVFEDRGFKFGDYVELLFDYDSMMCNDCDEFVFSEFEIDDVKINITNPSFLFDVVMNGFSNDKYYDNNYFYTISLKGITEENYEDYLTKALFLIGYYNPSVNDTSYPECYEFLGELYFKYAEDESIIERRRKDNPSYSDKKFNDIKYPEALAFYNEGKVLFGHEISFQYFYKVIEHFFLICRQDEFRNIITEYNSRNNINEFIDKVTKIYRQQEDSQLKVLLESIEPDIQAIVSECKKNGYIIEDSVDAFSDALYLYRNSIVHGKSDDKFVVKTPSSIGLKQEKFWNLATEQIAEKLIVKYCL